jgi:hypothetical protein
MTMLVLSKKVKFRSVISTPGAVNFGVKLLSITQLILLRDHAALAPMGRSVFHCTYIF